jgi:hypothetical protein
MDLNANLNSIKAIRKLMKASSNPDEFWAVILALRGPDCPGSSQSKIPAKTSLKCSKLKDLTTERIRAITGLGGYGMSFRYTELSRKEVFERNKLLRQSSFHFRQHFIRAMLALREMKGYTIPEAELDFATASNK